jgi:hypothetical protein
VGSSTVPPGRPIHAMSTNQQRADAFSVLGPDDPLARVTAQLSVATERSVAVSVMLVLGIVAVIVDMSVGAPVVVAAAVVLAALIARIGSLRAASYRRALELIAQGRGELPIEAVARVRRRLLDRANRERLARTLDVIRVEAGRPPIECHAIRPLYSVPVVRAVSAELGELAGLVRQSGGVRGLAATEQMVTDGRSPLYGDAEAILRQELARIRFLFRSRDVDGGAEWGSLPIPGRARQSYRSGGPPS